MNMNFYKNIMLSISLIENVKKIEDNILEIEKLINDVNISFDPICNLIKCREYLGEVDFIISKSKDLLMETVLRNK